MAQSLKVEFGLSHAWGSNPHHTTRQDDQMIQRGKEISALLSSQPRGQPKPYNNRNALR